jgi:hypothetical protein
MVWAEHRGEARRRISRAEVGYQKWREAWSAVEGAASEKQRAKTT